MVETPSSLLGRLRKGQESEDWRQFVALYQPLLLRWVQRLGIAPDDASDVVQEIFTSLVKSLPDFQYDRDRGRFRSWLWRVMHNAVISWFRRQARRVGDPVTPEHLEALAQAAEEPSAEWVLEERQRIVHFALEQVRRQCRPETWSCFQWHLLEGQPASQVAQRLGLSTNQVYVHTSRTLARVRKQCAEYLERLGHE